jgi:hypothetical protein
MLTACVGHSAFERNCDSLDFVTASAASIPIVFFACRSYVYGLYCRLAISFVNFAFDTGCHLSGCLFVRMRIPLDLVPYRCTFKDTFRPFEFRSLAFLALRESFETSCSNAAAVSLASPVLACGLLSAFNLAAVSLRTSRILS